MKLFMPNPKKGFIVKLSKFIGLKEVNTISVRKYASSLREFLPHIQKHIKDYFTGKFKFIKNPFYLLQNFSS